MYGSGLWGTPSSAFKTWNGEVVVEICSWHILWWGILNFHDMIAGLDD